MKLMPGEIARHEQIGTDEEDHFRLTTFNVVMDQIIASIESRFEEHGSFYGDLECFDPRRFPEISQSIPINSLNRICEIIPGLQKEKLKEELMTFAQLWPQLSKRDFEDVYEKAELAEDGQESDFSETIEIEDENPPEKSDRNSRCSDNVKCNNCLLCHCVFKVLYRYNLYCTEFKQLFTIQGVSRENGHGLMADRGHQG